MGAASGKNKRLEKRVLVLRTSRRFGGWMRERKKERDAETQTRGGHSFTRRLHSMFIVLHFNLDSDQPATAGSLTLK